MRAADGWIGSVESVVSFRSVLERGALLDSGGLEGQRGANLPQIWHWPLQSLYNELW